MTLTPVVMLVHGGFADSSSFSALIPELMDGGLNVVAPAMANRGPTSDAPIAVPDRRSRRPFKPPISDLT